MSFKKRGARGPSRIFWNSRFSQRVFSPDSVVGSVPFAAPGLLPVSDVVAPRLEPPSVPGAQLGSPCKVSPSAEPVQLSEAGAGVDAVVKNGILLEERNAGIDSRSALQLHTDKTRVPPAIISTSGSVTVISSLLTDSAEPNALPGDASPPERGPPVYGREADTDARRDIQSDSVLSSLLTDSAAPSALPGDTSPPVRGPPVEGRESDTSVQSV